MKARRVTIRRWFIPLAVILLLTVMILLGIYLGSRLRQPSDVVFESLSSTLDMDESYEARRMAARALGKAGDKKAIKPLLEAYETDPIVRREVVHSLRDLGVSPEEMGTFYQEATEPSLVEDLVDYVRGFDLRWYLVVAAAVAIGMGAATYRATSRVSLSTGKKLPAKARVSMGMIVLLTVTVSLIWLRLLPTPTEPPEIKAATAEMVMIELAGDSKDRSMVPRLIEAVSNKEKLPEIRCKAAESLGKIGDPEALSPLLSVSSEPGADEKIRIYALWAVGNISADEDKREEGLDYADFVAGQVEEYSSMLSYDSCDPYAYLGRARAHIALGNYPQAIADLNMALSYKQTLAEGYYQRGTAYTLKGEPSKAIEDFTHAMEWGLRDGDVYCRRASAHAAIGAIEQALSDYASCASTGHSRADVHLSQGLLYRESEQYAQAIEQFEKYLLLSPDAPDEVQVRQWIEEINEREQE